MSIKKTLLFFALFFFVIAPLYWFAFLIPVNKFKQLPNEAPKIIKNFVDQVYPNDFVIKIRNGQISTNKPSPYCMIFDKNSKTGIVFDEYANISTFLDTKKASYSYLCNAVVLVGKNFIIYPDSEGASDTSYKVQQIPSDVNYTITRGEIKKLEAEVLPALVKLANNLYYLVPFVLALFLIPLFALYNIWYALVSLVIFKIFKINPPIDFGSVYAKTLFTLFLWTVFNWIVIKFLIGSLIFPNFKLAFPFLNTIIVTTGTVLMEKYHFFKKSNKN